MASFFNPLPAKGPNPGNVYIIPGDPVLPNYGGQAVNDGKNVVSSIKSVNDFVNVLGKQATWIRVAEFTVGAMLIAIGLNAALKQSTGVNPAGIAKTGAKTAGKAAAL